MVEIAEIVGLASTQSRRNAPSLCRGPVAPGELVTQRALVPVGRYAPIHVDRHAVLLCGVVRDSSGGRLHRLQLCRFGHQKWNDVFPEAVCLFQRWARSEVEHFDPGLTHAA